MEAPSVAFVADRLEPPGVEIRINFGVFAGRDVTAAEVEELARELHARVAEFAIVSERRYEFADDVEAAVHLVRVELDEASEELRGRLLEIVERWAQASISERHTGVAEL